MQGWPGCGMANVACPLTAARSSSSCSCGLAAMKACCLAGPAGLGTAVGRDLLTSSAPWRSLFPAWQASWRTATSPSCSGGVLVCETARWVQMSAACKAGRHSWLPCTTACPRSSYTAPFKFPQHGPAGQCRNPAAAPCCPAPLHCAPLPSLCPSSPAPQHGSAGQCHNPAPCCNLLHRTTALPPPLHSMARLDKVKNLTGLAEWYASSPRLRSLVNLVIVGERWIGGSCDGGCVRHVMWGYSTPDSTWSSSWVRRPIWRALALAVFCLFVALSVRLCVACYGLGQAGGG